MSHFFTYISSVSFNSGTSSSDHSSSSISAILILSSSDIAKLFVSISKLDKISSSHGIDISEYLLLYSSTCSIASSSVSALISTTGIRSSFKVNHSS